ncbi:hypothetical protein AB0C88_37625 [Streptomyces chartreusis]|uniref:hypothetical protein n=1 Tax=Streptomyces chartreusis TaxID=1969 RepID=UPI0033D9D1F2
MASGAVRGRTGSGGFAVAWSKTIPKLKKLRPGAMLTGGFTLISAGAWNIFGIGVGLITAGVLLCTLQWWVDSD